MNRFAEIQRKHNERYMDIEILLLSKKDGLVNPNFLRRYRATKNETVGACIFCYSGLYKDELDFVTITNLKTGDKKSYDTDKLDKDALIGDLINQKEIENE
jgi:hypothetical protein